MFLTGIPHEQEMPAPVTTTIFLHFATESERLARARRVDGSVCNLSRLRATVMIACAETCLRGRLSFETSSRGWWREKRKLDHYPAPKRTWGLHRASTRRATRIHMTVNKSRRDAQSQIHRRVSFQVTCIQIQRFVPGSPRMLLLSKHTLPTVLYRSSSGFVHPPQ